MHQIEQGPVQLIPPAAHREEAGEVSAPSPLVLSGRSLRERPTPNPSRMLRTKWICCTCQLQLREAERREAQARLSEAKRVQQRVSRLAATAARRKMRWITPKRKWRCRNADFWPRRHRFRKRSCAREAQRRRRLDSVSSRR